MELPFSVWGLQGPHLYTQERVFLLDIDWQVSWSRPGVSGLRAIGKDPRIPSFQGFGDSKAPS